MNKKTFKDLVIGDYIWYYDHYKLHKQKITHAELQLRTEEINSMFYGKVIKQIKEIYIEAGKGTKMYISSYNFDKDTLNWRGIPRFTSYEAALNYISYLKTKHIQKANKLQKRLDRELNIISKYEF